MGRSEHIFSHEDIHWSPGYNAAACRDSASTGWGWSDTHGFVVSRCGLVRWSAGDDQRDMLWLERRCRFGRAGRGRSVLGGGLVEQWSSAVYSDARRLAC